MNHFEQRIVQKTLISNYKPKLIDELLIVMLFVSMYTLFIQDFVVKKLMRGIQTAELINDVY